MSLDICLEETSPHQVACHNITGNLCLMFEEAGVIEALYDSSGKLAKDIVEELSLGLKKMEEDPDRFRKLDSPNGWGKYEDAISFLSSLIDSCYSHPNAKIISS